MSDTAEDVAAACERAYGGAWRASVVSADEVAVRRMPSKGAEEAELLFRTKETVARRFLSGASATNFRYQCAYDVPYTLVNEMWMLMMGPQDIKEVACAVPEDLQRRLPGPRYRTRMERTLAAAWIEPTRLICRFLSAMKELGLLPEAVHRGDAGAEAFIKIGVDGSCCWGHEFEAFSVAHRWSRELHGLVRLRLPVGDALREGECGHV